jgi:vesicular inhibitory amino acid transporter
LEINALGWFSLLLRKSIFFTAASNNRVAYCSFSICTIIYGGMAIMGFTMFGSETESQITLNLPSKHIISKVAVWTTV